MKPLLNESDLIQLISKGDQEAFSLFYKTYLNNLSGYVFTICNDKETSEEIVQDLFLKIWENRSQLPYITAVKSYLYRSAKNLLLDRIRRSRAESKVLDVIEMDNRGRESNSEHDLIYKEYYTMAQHAIELLPEKRKEIFKLRLDDGLSLDEIACKLCISKSVVKKQLYSGISFVRKYLYQHGQIIAMLLISSLVRRFLK
jgi:RNA polymerase sigma-70 factor (family 1)